MTLSSYSRLVLVTVLAAGLGACAAGGDRSVFDLMLLRAPDPPKPQVLPITAGTLDSRVKRDGYPDPSFLPNPERQQPNLSDEERRQASDELAELGESRMQGRLMTCEAADPADCVR